MQKFQIRRCLQKRKSPAPKAGDFVGNVTEASSAS